MPRSLIEQIHTYLREALRRRPNRSVGDLERVAGKRYPRMHQYPLPAPEELGASLRETLLRRSSRRDHSLARAMTAQELGTLLGLSLGKIGSERHRTYASGGGLYPLEAYALVQNVSGFDAGVYHYDPDAHVLERLWPIPEKTRIGSVMTAAPWAASASCIIAITCVWERTRKKYADFSYLLALIESGGAGQNVALVAAALGLSACAVAGFDEDAMSSLLDLPPGEHVLYTIAVGRSE